MSDIATGGKWLSEKPCRGSRLLETENLNLIEILILVLLLESIPIHHEMWLLLHGSNTNHFRQGIHPHLPVLTVKNGDGRDLSYSMWPCFLYLRGFPTTIRGAKQSEISMASPRQKLREVQKLAWATQLGYWGTRSRNQCLGGKGQFQYDIIDKSPGR